MRPSSGLAQVAPCRKTLSISGGREQAIRESIGIARVDEDMVRCRRADWAGRGEKRMVEGWEVEAERAGECDSSFNLSMTAKRTWCTAKMFH